MNKIKLPVTRYYGSKRRIIDQIWQFIESENIEFNSVLDLFGGTGTFAYKSKMEGKEVIYNDIFKFNSIIGKSLIQNNSNKITQKEIEFVLTKDNSFDYKYHIKEVFKDIYYLEEENILIDIIVQNINRLKKNYSRYIAFYGLFQTCLIKRPFNTFHRKNLNLRINDVKRNFGNKVTWEKRIEDLFRKFCKEANSYIIDNGKKNKSINSSALKCKKTADLIYIDPPYVSEKGSHVDYHSRYHFLEALVHYEDFRKKIKFDKLNHEVQIGKSLEFETKKNIKVDIEKIIKKYQEKIIVFSYRNYGIPSIQEIEEIFIKNNMTYTIYTINDHSYALNLSNKILVEYLFVARKINFT